jgi:polysaccharide export outer membrane protein
MPFGSVYAQVSNLGSFASLGSMVEGANQDLISKPDSNDTDDEEEKSTKVKQEFNFEDKNYGYTGGKNFVNPPQGKFFDEPLSFFGYDFFVDAPSTFSPTRAPTSPDYVLGPGDNVNINYFGNQNRSHQLEVTSDGEIFIPQIGPVSVAGLTFLDFKETIQQIVSNQMIGTKVSINMGQLRSIDIFVLGEAYQPGVYTVSSHTTLTNAIFKSGGVNVTGSLRNIQLKRKGEVISTFDFYDLLLKGDTSKDTRMMQGDVVFIPPITKTVGVAGEIWRPGIYELKEDETLGDLIKFAGNLKPKADIFSATLHRIDSSSNGFNLIPVALNDSSLVSLELNNGDVLSIYPVVDNLKNAVLMTGHAQQPGFFPWKEGMRIGDIIKSKDHLLSMTDLTYVLVKREDKVSQKNHYLQVDLEEIFSNDASASNILLEARDEILLFPSLLTPGQITTQLIQDRYVLENDKMILEEGQWSPMTYLRKSLMDEAFSIGRNMGTSRIDPVTGMPTERGVGLEEEVRRYYEYSIYDYCTISEDLAISIVEAYGFRPKTKVPFEDLERLSTPEDLNSLLQAIEQERAKVQNFEAEGMELESTLTDLCRRQLLDPVIGILKRQRASTKETKTVSVFGSVRFPGTYPLTNGMVLEDAVKAAGGLKDATFASEIEISRITDVGKKYSVSNIFASLSDNKAVQMPLKEMDIINLKQLSTGVRTVEITGEVYFAGVYPISENQTLSELIQRAGGLTEYASAEAAIFQRESLKEAELERLNRAKKELSRKILLATQNTGLGQESMESETTDLLTALLSRESTGGGQQAAMGRLVVDLEAIIDGSVIDLFLEDGDSVHIPVIQRSVSVIGEVFVANSHLFKEDLSINDYISLSGGINDYADEANIYLIKADGSIVSPSLLSGGSFFRRASSELQPGDAIVVPLEVQPFSGIRATTEITQIIYQMAVAAAAVASF